MYKKNQGEKLYFKSLWEVRCKEISNQFYYALYTFPKRYLISHFNDMFQLIVNNSYNYLMLKSNLVFIARTLKSKTTSYAS